MQFQVPQFIEVEDKIIGPLTFRQFLYVAGGVGLAYIIWRLLPLFIAAPLMLAVVGLGVALAFFKFNDRPFIVALENGFYYLLHSKLYIWDAERAQRENRKKARQKAQQQERAQIEVPKLSDSKLHDLAWSLDIKEKVQQAVNERQQHDMPTSAA